jgi:glycosyltransferase involved in cell wall biosynthesis
MTGTPRVSVVIPLYNAAPYIAGAVESVLTQDYRDFELLVVDDASTDDSVAIVEAIADPRLRLLRHSVNQGVAAARNTALGEAVGDVIATVGADDAMKPGNLAAKVAVLDDHPDVGVVFGNAELIDEEGARLGVADPARATGLIPQPRLFSMLLYGNPFVDVAAVVRRSVLDQVGLFDGELRHGEDWDLWLRVGAVADAFYLEAPLVQHRLSLSSLRWRNSQELTDLRCMERIIAKATEGDPALFADAYWSNYFRMLRSKVAVLPARQIVSLYAEGRRARPGRGLPRSDVALLAKTALCAVAGRRGYAAGQSAVRAVRGVRRPASGAHS